MMAKIIDGVFTPAPRKIQTEIDGEPYTVYNPTVEMLEGDGWLPVVETESPDDAPDGYHYEPFYTEFNGRIVQSWVQIEDPIDPDPEISADEALEIIMGGAV